MEPSKHQYDFDSATCLNFLREFDLMDDFKLNLEVNHATLAQHTFEHELQVAADAGALGSMDANRGDYQNGWDTDQFPNSYDVPLKEEKQLSPQAQQLRKLILGLPKMDKIIITMHLDTYSNEEIAEMIGLTKNHVSVKLHRIKNHIKSTLKNTADGTE